MANRYLDHVSFGHDIEAAYLMLEAAEALGLPVDGPTLTVARKMVDHTLARGWDTDRGGIYYEGYYFRGDSFAVINRSKNWWVQAEGLNSLLQMSRLFPQDQKYEQAFRKQWDYIRTYMIDPEHGGWYENGLDNDPDAEKAPKAAIWKANYHNARALMNCIRLLEKDSKKEEQTGE
jgi:mannobiose 2-epimerase